MNSKGKFVSLVGGLGLFAVGVLLLFMSCTSVDKGHVAVPVLFGKVRQEVLSPGIHFINPFADAVHKDVRTMTYTMSSVAAEGQKSDDDSVDVISSDGMVVKMDVSVLYNLMPEKAPFVVENINGDVEENIIRPQIRGALRDQAASYTATELFSTKKAAFVDGMTRELQKNTAKYGYATQQVVLRSIKLPDSITKAINDKMQAQQRAQAMEFRLAEEKQEAERLRIKAEGEAAYNRINTQQLTPEILEARKIEAFKSLAQSGNVVVVPQNGNFLLNLPTKK